MPIGPVPGDVFSTTVASEPSSLRTSGGPELTATEAADARLREACLAAARYDWTGTSALFVPDSAVTTLRDAVRAYVEHGRREQLPPERVLVHVRGAMGACAARMGHARSELVLRGFVFDWFLDAYFPDGPRRTDGLRSGSPARTPSVMPDESH